MLAAAFDIPYVRRPYTLELPPHTLPKRLVGFNTGCSPGFPLKALDIALQVKAIRAISEHTGEPVLLLGGPEDSIRNNEIYGRIPEHTELSPTTEGLLVGAQHIDRCTVVFSGDSLGMHMAIARGKYVVAWFGLSCAQEIDLFDRGIKLNSPVSCSPCDNLRANQVQYPASGRLDCGCCIEGLALNRNKRNSPFYNVTRTKYRMAQAVFLTQQNIRLTTAIEITQGR